MMSHASTNCEEFAEKLLLVGLHPSLLEGVVQSQPLYRIEIEAICDPGLIPSLLSQNHYGLIILDGDLYDNNHIPLLGSPDSTSVYVISREENWDARLALIRSGVTAHFTKPVQMNEFTLAVISAIRESHNRQLLRKSNRELVASRTQAEHRAREKSEFLANMSHEIRTPMNGVIAMTDLLVQTKLSQEQREYVETIRTSGECLLGLIDDILHFSRIEFGRLELERREFSLRNCLEEAIDVVAPKAAGKGLDLAYCCSESIPDRFDGDVTRVRQILLNLLSNAVKFTASGEIIVRVSSDVIAETPSAESTLRLHFCVEDTGTGIPPERMSRLFQPFSQTDTSIAREYGGTGLGLAICRGLVELMNGRIWAESKLGVGTQFHFSIDLSKSQAENPVEPDKVLPLGHQTVLVVEDNPKMSQVITRQLSNWGLKVVSAGSPADVERMNSSAELDKLSAVLLDLELPNAASGHVLQLLKTRANTPIIFLRSVVTSVAPVSTPGLTLIKPLKRSQLFAALKHALSGTAFEPPANPCSAEHCQLSNRGAPLSILLVDDNSINQKVASRLLQKMGHTPDVASNGLEAVEKIEHSQYDLILMDVQMPLMNGLDATRRIRQMQKEQPSNPNLSRNLMIVAMTANAMHGDREKCLSAGMDDYLAKPLRPEMLKSILEIAAGRVFGSSGSLTPAQTNASSKAAHDSVTVLETPPVDLERLYDFAGDDPNTFNELLALYIKQTSEQLDQIRRAVQEGKHETVSRIAHSCAGASATCGMLPMVSLLRRLELLEPTLPSNSANDLLRSIEAEFARVRDFLTQHKKLPLAV